MNKNIKNYNNYKSMNMDNVDEDMTNYPQDSYVRPGTKSNVGKLDNYSKEKQDFEKKKAKVVFKETNKNMDKNLDDLIPNQIGDAIDNVFSSVDSLLNKTGKLFFGSKKAKPVNSRPVVATPKPTPKITPTLENKPSKIVAKAATTQAPTQSASNYYANNLNKPKNEPAPAAPPIIKKQAKAPIPDNVDRSPPVTRTTMIADLDLPIEILGDPDLVKYFDQMKLYDKKVSGGLCSISFNKASEILKNGRWGKLFNITYNQLKINTMMASADAGAKRFNGMLPVYKAMGREIGNTTELKKAIEDDINQYLKNGEGSGEFHKFTYKIGR